MFALVSSQITADVRLTRALTYSSHALLMWDYLLTLDDEVTYIWPSRSSVVKSFFIGNRYVNLLMQPAVMSQTAGVLPLHSNAACFAFSLIMALYQFWSYGSVHVLVLLRLWILNGRTCKITIVLSMLFALYLCFYIVAIARILGSITFNFNRAPSPGSCGAVLSSFSWLLWTLEAVLDVCLFGLMIFTLRRQRSTSEFSPISRLVRNLYRHAIIFFLANALSGICNTIAWSIFVRTPLYHISNSFPITLVNITGQRLAIDLRRLHIQKEITRSEVSREVEIQLAVLNEHHGVP